MNATEREPTNDFQRWMYTQGYIRYVGDWSWYSRLVGGRPVGGKELAERLKEFKELTRKH